jgi:hypothetical protein
MFDRGSGVCLWSSNDKAKEKFGDYPIEEMEKLPVSAELREELEYLITEHDKALNWEDPGGDLLWNDQQVTQFKQRAEQAYERLVRELGSDFQAEFKESWLI